MGCGQSKHAAHNPAWTDRHGTLPRRTALAEQETTLAKTTPRDAEAVGAELAEAGKHAAPVSPRIKLPLLDGHRSLEACCVRGRNTAGNLRGQ